MKKLYAIAVMLLIVTGAYAQNGSKIYNKYSDLPGATAVYISPTMFKLIGQLPDLDVEMASGEKMNVAPLVRSFDGFYILNVSDQTAAADLKQEVQGMIKSCRFEMLMEAKDDGSKVNMYISGNDKIISDLVLLAESCGSVQFICMEGSMDRKDFETLVAKSIK